MKDPLLRLGADEQMRDKDGKFGSGGGGGGEGNAKLRTLNPRHEFHLENLEERVKSWVKNNEIGNHEGSEIQHHIKTALRTSDMTHVRQLRQRVQSWRQSGDLPDHEASEILTHLGRVK